MARIRRFGRFLYAESALLTLRTLLVPKWSTKADWFARRWWRGHQSPNRIKNDFELSIVFALEFFKLAGQLNIASQHSPEVYKRAYSLDIYLHRTLAVQDAGKHENYVF